MTEAIVNEICQKEFGAKPDFIKRNLTGISSYVYSVGIGTAQYAVKISRNKELILGSSYWLDKLCDLNLPIPKILGLNVESSPFYCIMNFIPGQDLGLVYKELTGEQKKALACKIVACQNAIRKLPMADGYGFLHSYDDTNNKKKTWREVVESHILRSETRMRENGIFLPDYADRLRVLLARFSVYFDSIKPMAFFDDATTKNVLIHDGKLSGIIDLDWICFGDRLYVLALTTMSLINMRANLDYVEYWKQLENLDKVQEEVLSFYILVFCLDFMSEKGMKFNKDKPEPVNEEDKLFLENIFEQYMAP